MKNEPIYAAVQQRILQPAIIAVFNALCVSHNVMRWLQLRFDFDSTKIRPRCDHWTTYGTTAGLPVCVGCCAGA